MAWFTPGEPRPQGRWVLPVVRPRRASPAGRSLAARADAPAALAGGVRLLSGHAGGAVVEAFQAEHLQPGGEEDEQFHAPRAEANVEEIVHELVPHTADARIRRQMNLRESSDAGLHRVAAVVADHLIPQPRDDFRAFRARADQAHFALEHVEQ